MVICDDVFHLIFCYGGLKELLPFAEEFITWCANFLSDQAGLPTACLTAVRVGRADD